MPADSAKIGDIEMLVKKVKETTDHVDILFANAGATWGEKFDTHPDSAFAKVMDLNVKSVFNTIRLYVMNSFQVFLRLTSHWLEALAPFGCSRRPCLPPHRFAPLLQKNATLEAPSRVIVTASIAGLGVGSLGESATFGYSASKGTFHPLSPVKVS